MDFNPLDSISIGEELSQLCEAMTVKPEPDEDSVRYSAAAKLFAKQVTPNVIIDITGKDPITIKTDPDQNNLIANRRVAYENVPKKPSETLVRKPMKPLIHRCVGRIFAPSTRRRNQQNLEQNALLRQQAAELLRQLDDDSEGTQYADERETENIDGMEQDKENELPTITDSTQLEIRTLNLDFLANQQPVLIVTKPDVPPSQRIQQHYCGYCQRSFINKRGLTLHTNRTKMHAENVLKSQIERTMAANSQNSI